MGGLEALLAILIVAMSPVALMFVSRHYRLQERILLLRSEGESARIEELVADRKRLEERIENLESIVCEVEFDLDQRLRALPVLATRLP